MKIEITKDVVNHHTNPDYPTLRVRWNGEDRNFMVDEKGPNWVPRDKEVIDLVFNLMLLSPTFHEKLVRMVSVLEQQRR